MSKETFLEELLNTLESNKLLVFLIGFAVMLFDVLILDVVQDLLHFVLISSFFYFLRFRNTLQNILVITLLLVIPTATLFGKFGVAEKGSLWLFYFFIYQVVYKIILFRRSDGQDV